MEQKEIERIHSNLTKSIEKYINAIILKYGNYIPREKMIKLSNIVDYGSLIKIFDYGSINGYANNEGVNMPLCASRLLEKVSKVPLYGVYKKHKSYDSDTLVINNNTFINYILHVFISGTNVEGYYEDLLLHETVHFCGSGGFTALKEGITELLTRKIALEYGFRTNGCGYPKEVQVAYELQNVFGEEILDRIAFINSSSEIYMFLMETLGEEAAILYRDVSSIMEKEFHEKYYSKMDSYNGLSGILRKVINYKKIDYSKVYVLIEEYKKNNQTQNISSISRR